MKKPPELKSYRIFHLDGGKWNEDVDSPKEFYNRAEAIEHYRGKEGQERYGRLKVRAS